MHFLAWLHKYQHYPEFLLKIREGSDFISASMSFLMAQHCVVLVTVSYFHSVGSMNWTNCQQSCTSKLMWWRERSIDSLSLHVPFIFLFAVFGYYYQSLSLVSALSLSLVLQFCGKGLASKMSISTFWFCLLVFFFFFCSQPTATLSTCPIWRLRWGKTAVAFRISRFYIGDLIRLYTWSAAVWLAVLNTVPGIPYLPRIIGSFCWNI